MTIDNQAPPRAPDLSKNEARSLTARIQRGLGETALLLQEAKERNAAGALGYGSWKTYVYEEFGYTVRNADYLVDRAVAMREIEAETGSMPDEAPTHREAQAMKAERQAAAARPPDETVIDVQSTASPEVDTEKRVSSVQAEAPEPAPEPEPVEIVIPGALHARIKAVSKSPIVFIVGAIETALAPLEAVLNGAEPTTVQRAKAELEGRVKQAKEMAAEGKSQREIARAVGVSPSMVQKYLKKD